MSLVNLLVKLEQILVSLVDLREIGANTREFGRFTREIGANTREFGRFTREIGANTREFGRFTREMSIYSFE
ncbi:hypothetical protein QUF94_06975 [Peribacillus sp. NJ4]|uniref:hypothetical protein n=1 Tax=Peribacillus sp. NJ4 TaxID=3055862 RepID=UPI0025A2DED3|nr:hypothetical protein [Peribacillus sp. NJ4]MDM5211180.1 hypothetical protein [Peribacillus sp. NJ4]